MTWRQSIIAGIILTATITAYIAAVAYLSATVETDYRSNQTPFTIDYNER